MLGAVEFEVNSTKGCASPKVKTSSYKNEIPHRSRDVVGRCTRPKATAAAFG